MNNNLLTNNVTRCCKCGNCFKLTENQFLFIQALRADKVYKGLCKDCVSDPDVAEKIPENGGALKMEEIQEHENNSRKRDVLSAPEDTDSQQKIRKVLKNMTDLLIYKNQKYGDSALHPNNIFYKGDATNSILIRLDDKIGRIKTNTGDIRINDVCDIIGYLTLLLVSLDAKDSDFEALKD